MRDPTLDRLLSRLSQRRIPLGLVLPFALTFGLALSHSAGSTVSGNTAYQNGGDGISAGAGSTVSGNTAYGNIGDGIQSGNEATVQGNTVRSNGVYGLLLGARSAYRENVINNNTAGTVAGLGIIVNLLGNSCNGATTCP